ncbi:MAG: methionyl-tRNA formyltransferase [Clostridia bacterium]|nr:methionyl-tRNA formyltransferase [Clostridia bacterium]
MRIIFMGTPDFAVPSLRRLVEDGHDVVLVVSQPDKPVGRKQILTPTAVKAEALTHDLEVFQPPILKTDEVYEKLASYQPDLMVVAAYGRILSERLLTLPRYGCINVHASLLPKYRGAAPIQWAVLDGEPITGVTTMQMDVGLDTGDILQVSKREIPTDMTAGELFDLLAEDGAVLLSETIRALEAGTLTRTPQPDEGATYAPMLDKSYSPIDWEKPATVLHNLVRGLNPWPAATCRWNGSTMKVWKTMVGEATDQPAGTLLSLQPLAIACGGGTSLVLTEVQGEGCKRMNAADFVRGHALPIGINLKEG